MHPLLAMITDRHRVGGDEKALVQRVHLAARAGITLVQVRERDLDTRALTRLVRACVEAVQGTAARVLVNDRADVALAAGAHGVHLRGDSVDAFRARQLVPRPFLVGRSVHSADEAMKVATDDLDYLLFGTVFDTGSKPGRVAAGLAPLTTIAATVRIPVLAIGGITEARVAEVVRTGAAGVAAIGLFHDTHIDGLAELVGRLRRQKA